MSNIQPFHLAIPVNNLEACRAFYSDVLECSVGRSCKFWVDFNFFGHQLVIHYKPDEEKKELHTNLVDGKNIPVPHFGVILRWNDFNNLAENLKKKGINFVIEPYIRFKGKIGEQATMFFLDPSGYALEFKAFKKPSQLFAK